MAPLALRSSSSADSNDQTVGGMPPFVVASIVIAILLGGIALTAFLMFGCRSYRAIIAWWKSKKTSAPSTPTPTIPMVHASRGGVTHPTASLPRFAQKVGTAMRLPLPKTSSTANRPTSSRRAGPTGMGPLHARRGSEASANSTTELLRVPFPSSPKPAFVRGSTATGQGITR